MKNIFKAISILTFISILGLSQNTSSFAAGSCTNPGETSCTTDVDCNAPQTCNQIRAGLCLCGSSPGSQQPGNGGTSTGTDPVGTVKPPFTTGFWANNQNGSGLIALMRAFLALIFTVGGIYAFIRVVLAGLKFMSAGGDSKAIQQSWDSIWQAMLGLVIIVSSLIIAVILGQLLFGDATAILIPKIYPAQ